MLRLGRTAVLWVGFAAAYLFFAGTLSRVELVAAGVCACAATALALGMTATSTRHFRFGLPFRAAARALRSLATDTAAVGAALLGAAMGKAVGSALVRQPFEPGNDSPADQGRRAAVVLGMSLAPQSFVVRQDADGALLVHTWPAKPPSSDTRWPL